MTSLFEFKIIMPLIILCKRLFVREFENAAYSSGKFRNIFARRIIFKLVVAIFLTIWMEGFVRLQGYKQGRPTADLFLLSIHLFATFFPSKGGVDKTWLHNCYKSNLED